MTHRGTRLVEKIPCGRWQTTTFLGAFAEWTVDKLWDLGPTSIDVERRERTP